MSIIISIEITDPVLIAGVEYAMNLYNADKPEVLPLLYKDGTPQIGNDGQPLTRPNPERFTDRAAYVRFVGFEAVKSYARQKAQADFDAGDISKAQRDAALAALA